jgi:hypothetical protein
MNECSLSPEGLCAARFRYGAYFRSAAVRMLLWNQVSTDPIRAAEALIKLEARERHGHARIHHRSFFHGSLVGFAAARNWSSRSLRSATSWQSCIASVLVAPSSSRSIARNCAVGQPPETEMQKVVRPTRCRVWNCRTGPSRQPQQARTHLRPANPKRRSSAMPRRAAMLELSAHKRERGSMANSVGGGSATSVGGVGDGG